MNRRQKKKQSFKKVIFIVKPGLDDDPEECPTFKAYSNKGLLKLIDKLKKTLDFEFLFVRVEYPFERYRVRTR